MNLIDVGPGLAVSRLGFGCAPVMGRVGKRASLNAMACAFEHGVTHFDIARSYGFGDAEQVLGRFVASRRSRVTVTSKFGVVPTTLRPWQRLARPVVRLLRQVAPGARTSVSRASSRLLASRRFDTRYARDCLATSLRALGTDYLDFYLLHEPDPEALQRTDELRRFLEDEVRGGRIRAWGLAHPVDAASFDPSLGASVLQFESPLAAAASTDPAPLPFGPGDDRLAFVTRPFAGGLAALPASVRQLARRLDLDDVQLAMALACAAAGSRGGVVAGMFDATHIGANVRAVEHWESNRQALEPALRAAGCAVRDGARPLVPVARVR